MPKQILITGGLGFLGRHAARALSKQGHRVIGIGRGQWSPEFAKEWGFADGRAWPITTEALESLKLEPDWILHCAGSSAANPLISLEDNITCAASVLEYARARANKVKLALVSSAAVYGDGGTTPIAETQSARPATVYGNHKALVEDLARWYGREYRLSLGIVRFFSLYGVGMRKHLLWDACEAIAQRGGKPFGGTGDELCDFLHVDDATRLLPLVVESASPLCPIWNGGSGQGVKARDVFGAISQALQAPPPVFTGSAERGQARGVADITRVRGLGFKTEKDWATGLTEYLNWFRSLQPTRRVAA